MFVNTKYFSPVINEGLTLAHPKSYEFREWWEEEHRRCIEGYEVGGTRITGDHYWYLNFWKIRGTNPKTGRKDLISPRFLDMDYEYFNALEECRKRGKHMIVVKRRQSGFSEKHAALMGKEFTMFPHSQTVITAAEEKYSNATMRMVIRGLNSLEGTQFYKRRTPDTLDYCQAKYKVIIDGHNSWKGSFSEIYNLTSHNNPQATIGKSPSFIYFEEGGKFPGLIDSFKYIQPALEAEGEKTGIAVIVGTGGDMEKGADELEEIFYNPDAYDMMSFKNYEAEDESEKVGYFCPGWQFLKTDNEGNSLKQESMDYIEKKREQARKSSKMNAYITEVTQMPLVPSEAFMRTGGNLFNQALLNAQYARIRNDKKLSLMPEVGRLSWVRGEKNKIEGVAFERDPNGPLVIIEHPETDNNGKVYLDLYVAGTDSYDRDEAPTSDSQGSTSMYKMFLNANSTSKMFVARYTERANTAEEFYERTAMLCYYYNAPNLIEWSNIGIFDWYKRNGFEGYLKTRPEVAYSNIKDSKSNNRYGIDPSTKEFWMLSYRDYIEKHSESMFDMHQIDRALKYRNDRDYNCDITISSSLCIVHALDYMNIQAKKNEPKVVDEFYHFKSSRGGFNHVFER